MYSFLIWGKNKEKVKEAALKIVSKRKVDKFDTEILEFEKQMGIPDVRLLQKNLFLKPLRSEEKAEIILAFDGLTLEAQNALLKILEEPPAHTIIIICVLSLEFILPTIISRCTVLEEKETEIKFDENFKNAEIILALKNQTIAEKLKLAQDLAKEKGSALRFLESCVYGLNETLLENVKTKNQTQDIKRDLKNLQEFYNSIKNTNVNLRLALENLFLKI